LPRRATTGTAVSAQTSVVTGREKGALRYRHAAIILRIRGETQDKFENNIRVLIFKAENLKSRRYGVGGSVLGLGNSFLDK